LYSKLLDWLLLGTGINLKHIEAVQFAFKPGRYCHEVVIILRRIIKLAIEWRIHVFILDGDISRAYDYSQHDKVSEALVKRGAHHLLVAAIMREVTGRTCKLKLGTLESNSELPRTRAIWQGDPLLHPVFSTTRLTRSQSALLQLRNEMIGDGPSK
jgi:hypothetical protein